MPTFLSTEATWSWHQPIKYVRSATSFIFSVLVNAQHSQYCSTETEFKAESTDMASKPRLGIKLLDYP